MRVAALQTDIVWENPGATCERLRPWIHAAAAAGAGLAVLPEMFACGFSMNTARLAEPPGGPSTRFLSDQAAQHGLWLAGSVPERPPGATRPANTLILAGPAGELHRYRKMRPFSPAGEAECYQAGEAPITVSLTDPRGGEHLRVTPFICYDLRFADLFWERAEATDVYLVVANWPEARRHHWTALLAARAIENQAFVVGVNRVGSGGGLRYTGDSRILDPGGEVLAAGAEHETMLLTEVSADRVSHIRRELPFLADRPPRAFPVLD